ncbi:MAG: creatininase family protein [Saccharofermentanales bacterium]
MNKKVKYEEMLPSEFEQAITNLPVVIIPTGLLEWHGDHLPLGQDALKAYGICLRIAEKLGGGIVMPPNYYGRPGFSRYIGTLTFTEACIDLLFTELFGQLKKVGSKVIVLITGHYGDCQVDCLKRIAGNFMVENPDVTVIAQPEYENVLVNGEVPADHAGKWETSMFWYLYPELTHMENFKPEETKIKTYKEPSCDFYKESENWTWKEDLAQTSSRELGEKAIEIISGHLVQVINDALSKQTKK